MVMRDWNGYINSRLRQSDIIVFNKSKQKMTSLSNEYIFVIENDLKSVNQNNCVSEVTFDFWVCFCRAMVLVAWMIGLEYALCLIHLLAVVKSCLHLASHSMCSLLSVSKYSFICTIGTQTFPSNYHTQCKWFHLDRLLEIIKCWIFVSRFVQTWANHCIFVAWSTRHLLAKYLKLSS